MLGIGATQAEAGGQPQFLIRALHLATLIFGVAGLAVVVFGPQAWFWFRGYR